MKTLLLFLMSFLLCYGVEASSAKSSKYYKQSRVKSANSNGYTSAKWYGGNNKKHRCYLNKVKKN